MESTTITERLGRYRQAVYRCLTGARAALFDRCRWVMLRPECERCPEDANARR